MRRRVGVAILGAGVAATALAVVLVSAPFRPTGLWLTLVLLGIVAPAVAAGGVRTALRATGEQDHGTAAGLTALGTPVTVLLALFSIHAGAVETRPGAQQVGALLLGSCVAAGLGARFSGPQAREEPRSG